MTPEQFAREITQRYYPAEPKGQAPLNIEADIADAVRAAVAGEREACAELAESRCDEWQAEGDGESVIASQSLYGMADAGRQIAAAIRSRGG